MTAPRALIILRAGVDEGRQMAVCTERVQEAGYQAVSLLHADGDWSVAERLIRSGMADVVVVAFTNVEDELERRIEAAGGSVDAIHRAGRRTTVRSMVAVLHYAEGWSVKRISSTFGISAAEVTDHIRRTRPRREAG